MPDLLEFMLGKKDKKSNKPKETVEEKNNYSIYMPVGVYEDDIEETEEDTYVPLQNRRGDFNPYEIEKLQSEDQLVELKRQISRLEDDICSLNDKLKDLRNLNSEMSVQKSKYEYISSKYRSMVEKIIKIMPYYQEIEFTGIGMPEQWTDKKLVEIFVNCIEHIKLEYAKKVKELEMLKVNSQSVNREAKVDDFNKSSAKEADIKETSSIESSNNFEDELNELNNEINSYDVNLDTNNTVNQNMDKELVQRYYDKVKGDEQLIVILETVGETGLSRVVDLKETDKFKRTFVSSTSGFNQGALSKKMQILVDLEIINLEAINTGRKGGYENIYSLTDLGVNLYKMLFSCNPVESEKENIRRQHTSLEHGYFIKTVAKELENKGYEVFDTPEDCIRKPLIALEEGDDKLRVEADLIIKKEDVEYIIECEMGTTSAADMNKKLDKLILVTNVISFIMNNQDSLNKTSAKVDKWISKKGRDSLKGYTFRFTTLDNLKNREIWQNKGPFN